MSGQLPRPTCNQSVSHVLWQLARCAHFVLNLFPSRGTRRSLPGACPLVFKTKIQKNRVVFARGLHFFVANLQSMFFTGCRAELQGLHPENKRPESERFASMKCDVLKNVPSGVGQMHVF